VRRARLKPGTYTNSPPPSSTYYLKMRKSSSISESPGKRGSLFNISANMQPMDHVSTGVE